MPQQTIGTLYPFIMMLVVFAFFYFFAVRPQKKREKQINEMREALRVGDRVTTIGGIRGKVVKLGEEYLTIETGNKRTQLEVTKWAIGTTEETNRPATDTVHEAPADDDAIITETEEEISEEDRGL